jgi:hypothetical protein
MREGHASASPSITDSLCFVGKEWVHARPSNPCRLRIGQRNFFWRLAPTAVVAARTATFPVTTLLIIAGGVESNEVLSNYMGCPDSAQCGLASIVLGADDRSPSTIQHRSKVDSFATASLEREVHFPTCLGIQRLSCAT